MRFVEGGSSSKNKIPQNILTELINLNKKCPPLLQYKIGPYRGTAGVLASNKVNFYKNICDRDQICSIYRVNNMDVYELSGDAKKKKG